MLYYFKKCLKRSHCVWNFENVFLIAYTRTACTLFMSACLEKSMFDKSTTALNLQQ